MYYGVYFFFSSRRRHTRYIGDWSSDVCSSDLLIDVVDQLLEAAEVDRHDVVDRQAGEMAHRPDRERRPADLERSEERRVGKECRSRWGRWQLGKRANIPKMDVVRVV